MAIVGANWSYSGNPATDDKDAVRFLINDTDSRRQLVSDEEILWTLSDTGNRYSAAAACCRIIGSDLEASGSVTVGDMTQSGGRDAAGWMLLAETYERRASVVSAPPVPIFGGESVDRRNLVAADTDRRPPTFHPFQFARSTGVTAVSS